MRRVAIGSSFLTLTDGPIPDVALGATVLHEGDNLVIPEEDLVSLQIRQIVLDPPGILEACDLSIDSRLRLIVDLECVGFNFRETMFSMDVATEMVRTLRPGLIGSIPRSVVAEGMEVRLLLVAARPQRTSPRGCGVAGGVLWTWAARTVPRNTATMFPFQESHEPSLWRLEIAVDGPEDLEIPFRAAVRLFLDSKGFSELMGSERDDETRRQTAAWIITEVRTSLLQHVLSNDELAIHLADLVARNQPAELSMDPASVGYVLLGLMRRVSGEDPGDLSRRMRSDPVATFRYIRERVRPPLVASKSRSTSKDRAS